MMKQEMIGVTQEKIIKQLMPGMIKWVFLTIIFIGTSSLEGTVIAVPEPDVMLEKSDFVVLATLTESGGVYKVKVIESFKQHNDNTLLEIQSSYPEEAFSLPYLEKIIQSDKFVFVGNLNSDKDKVIPQFGICSFWPQGTNEELLPYRKLDDVIDYIQAQLNTSKNTTNDKASEDPSSDIKDTSRTSPPGQSENQKSVGITEPEVSTEPNHPKEKVSPTVRNKESVVKGRWPIIAVILAGVMAIVGLLRVLFKGQN